MSRFGFLFHFSILFLIMLVSAPIHAKPLQCKKVVISGEVGWPPFSYIKDGNLAGAGVDLGRLLFHELNIPVEVRAIQDQKELEHQLRQGLVDVIVATYDVAKYEDYVRLVLPHYFEDTLAIVVPQDKWFEFADWHDLMGRSGITTSNNQLGREFDDFASKHLNIKSVGNLRLNFRKLAQGEHEYIIGSAQLLKSGANWYTNSPVEFLPMLVSAEDVYMGISANSPCKNYAAYLRNRLKELNENQIIYTLVQKHTQAEDKDI